MATKKYSQTITDMQVMVKGIKKNQDVLSICQIADGLQTNVDPASH